MKKNIYFLFLVFVFGNAVAVAQWDVVSIPSMSIAAQTYFLDADIGFAAGDGIAKTVDGGLHWTVSYPSTTFFNDITFKGEEGYAVGYGGEFYDSYMIKTTDRGSTWFNLTIPEMRFLSYVCCRQGTEVIAMNNFGTVIKSTDAGVSWQQTATLNSMSSFSNLIDSHGRLYAFDRWDACWSSLDGTTWTLEPACPFRTSDVAEYNNTLYSCGVDTVAELRGIISTSSDQGKSWQNQHICDTWLSAIAVINSNLRFATGSRMNIGYSDTFVYMTNDGGQNWQTIKELDSITVLNISYTDRYIYFSGWKDTRSDSVYIRESRVVRCAIASVGILSQTSVAPSFRLGQNYPNPFNPTTHIAYTILERSHVILTVYNALGKEATVLVNSMQAPGEYDVNFSGVGLPSGAYFYNLQSGSFSETKKMILVK